VQAWTGTDVPSLPGRGLPLRLWDSASGSLRVAASGDRARMYVCGITPYDATHLGHANTYLTFDLVQRVWLDAGLTVTYVQNVTDVDDPLLERAALTGENWHDLAVRETDLFRADMEALRVLPPAFYVGAVEAIPRIVALIDVLRDRGAAYEVDGDWYFSVGSDPEFGSVSHLGRLDMLRVFGANGGDPEREGKKDPLDALIWLAARPGEPSWDSPLGPGRPGWHVECAAIALDHLGIGFDVQGGGRDLVFPHHEMSASHGSVAASEWPFAGSYVHSGMVALDGQKMSKSLGNLELVSRLRLAGEDPMAIRLALLSQHYRDDWEWSESLLVAARARLALWRAAVALEAGPPAEPVLDRVRALLADDLQAPGALDVIDAWAHAALAGAASSGVDASAPALVRSLVDGLLGVAL
jgi:L-cysteine:1D-myo-inositol 2-amino-2-deoxy-alpha-D-glucopyranoside ligase